MQDLDLLSIGTALEIIAYDEARSAYGSHPELRPEYATRESRERFDDARSNYVSLTLFLDADHGSLHGYPETLTAALGYLRDFGIMERKRAKRRAGETIDELVLRLADRTQSARERFERDGIAGVHEVDETDIAAYLALSSAIELSGYFRTGVGLDVRLPIPAEEVEKAFLDR